MDVISEVHTWDAWSNATARLLDKPGHRISNLAVVIEEPIEIATARAVSVDRAVNAKQGGRVMGVARTIMPKGVLSAADWKSRAIAISRKWPKRTYFRRMIDFDDQGTNQVAGVIKALRAGGVDPNPIVFVRPGYSAPAQIGFPCLSQVQFHRDRDTDDLDATAVYRSQYFDTKALGNFIGLGRLLDLVAREAHLESGSLTVIATDARIKSHITELRGLVQAGG